MAHSRQFTVRTTIAAASSIVVLAIVARIAGSVPASESAPQAITLSIVGTNDLHGGIFPRDGRGGLALLGGYMKNLRAVRARDGGAVLLIDGGDMFQGTLESNFLEGAPVVAAYNALGYAAAAVGNHEFDFGPEGPAATPRSPADDPRGALKARASEATFPFLAANLIDLATDQPVEWPNTKPTLLVEREGVKVGVIGVMTSGALRATIAANVGGLRVASLGPTIRAHASRLRSQGADVVIVAAHAGGRCSNLTQPSDAASCDQSSEIIGVARELPAALVDVIVAGHTHAGMAHEVQGIAIIESFAGGRAFGRVDLVFDRGTRRITDKRIFPPRDLCARADPVTGGCEIAPVPSPSSVSAEYEGLPVSPDPSIVEVLAPALESVRALKARPVGIHLETPIRRHAGADSPLGNLFTDALREAVSGADLSLHNVTGGLRTDLPQGPLLYGSLYEVMPFDNKLALLRLTGAQVRKIFATELQRSSRILGVSGVRVRAQCSAGSLEVTLLRPAGTPIGDDEGLLMVTSDFLATGGDGILTSVIPPAGASILEDAPTARDVLADYLRRRGGQLREEHLVDVDQPRITYPGSLPVTCRS